MIAEKVYHGQYCILPGGTRKKYYYDDGPISGMKLPAGSFSYKEIFLAQKQFDFAERFGL